MRRALQGARGVQARWTTVCRVCSLSVSLLACGGRPEPVPYPPGVAAPASSPSAARTESDAAEPPAPAPVSGLKSLFVREARVDCEGEGPMKCLQVRESETEPWTLFYSSIVGFTYEESYAYELRVQAEMKPDAGGGRAPRRYRLVEVVSKTKIAR